MSDIPLEPGHIWKNNTTLQSADLTGVMASSGRGKTSLITFLYGVRKDYTGNILFDSVDIREFSLRKWSVIRRTQIACVFQDLRLVMHLTMKENLLLKNNLTSTYTEKEIKERAEMLGVGEKWDQSCNTLSLGQQQRVAILRGILQPFEMIMLDEPFSHLDKENIDRATKLILSECKSRNAGAMIVSLGESFGWNFNQQYKL
jgi:putative ABC transport system ATP-binding protein